jgi:DNA (cytosine-5)-methyltransferase 1
VKPRLLDLFCGAGGAAMGYARAGFEVVGVDIAPQPNYPFEFIQWDALALLSTFTPSVSGWWDEPPFAAVHASPPCQAYTRANNSWIGKLPEGRHPDLVAATRDLLRETGLPYVIENVPGAPLIDPVTICGLSLGLNVKRHRLFECSFAVMVPPCRDHDAEFLSVYGGSPRRRAKQIGRTTKGAGGPILRRGTASLAEGQVAMGIDWMKRDELSEAIPPAYCELIGHQLMTYLRASGRVPDDSSPAHRSDTSASLDLGSRTRRMSGPADSGSSEHSLPSVSAASGASSLRSVQPRGDRD